MKDEPFELVHGSGNVFRNFGFPDADVWQMRAILAAEIIKMLDREGLTVRGAHARTGIAAADFSRIRNAGPGAVYGGSADGDYQPAGSSD